MACGQPLESPVKIPPLPEIDLARICPLSEEQQVRALEAIRFGHPPYSYAPVRANLSDIVSIRPEMFDAVAATVPWAAIANDIRRRSRSDAEEAANLRVGRGLFDYLRAERTTGRRQDFFPLTLGDGARVTFWHPAVLTIADRPMVAFFDPRRTKALTREGRRFALSAMHERIRAADPDAWPPLIRGTVPPMDDEIPPS